MSERLLKHFDMLATAPDGVAKLRELILTLAVQGKLVPQDPNDEPASVLLQRIRAEKDRLIAEGKIKRDKPLPPITDEEKPFELPLGWEWVRLADLAWPQAGFAFKSSSFNEIGAGLPLIRIRDVGVSEPTTFFSGEFRSEFLVNAGDWLVSMDGEFRVREWLGKPALLNQRVTRLIFAGNMVEKTFVCSALQNELTKLQGQKAYTTVDHLSGGQISSRLVPLPPLAEQSRIVARVEELMRLCDALEAKRQLNATQHAQLLHTLLGTLTDSATPEELAANWQRVAAHFDLLLDRPEAVDALEQTILQLAVRGLLVPQDPTDEPASVLLQRIRAEKDRLIAERKTKRDKPPPPIADEEKPFELPQGWEWVRLSCLSPEFQNGASSRGDSSGKPITVLRLADIKNRRISLEDTRQIPIAESDIQKYQLRTGDILITRVNGSADIVGQFNLCDRPVDAIYCDHFIRMRVKADWLNPLFAALLGESDLVRQKIKAMFITTAGQKTVNQGHIGSLLFALPPLAEQSRIVPRVEELRQICNDLRQRLTASRTTQAHLAEALVDMAA